MNHFEILPIVVVLPEPKRPMTVSFAFPKKAQPFLHQGKTRFHHKGFYEIFL